ncbi:hypothetical protein SAMN05660909_01628 [Chitinophaga terrae (ex Kim and Jung 2007)]|uniref:PA14 domain-containing protein n=1 Tax=Chitinophaga terrae (ex Kim and Jung 2007) TaxID=408074 RepID=A0A1H4AKH5_9BACT|nr:hypothetical protein [Chitinophaga terrae (ex Kim and Jung 2007)]GEP89284.1 hypothetical protein CTE07_09290 [Chitinophaga terrae (ex Kim and Jung 2007)]SEA36301.1 hypothetical protein SAMN05660909_01628 [Chitinophaga terrae (ex Kim and Jung 2007)]
MIIKSIKVKKTLAIFFLSVLTVETLLPLRSWALTSGPSQPENKQFEAYSTNNMVDLFSGSFKYNIPIMDVDGYPLNLNYASGVGIDDEASWVGLGWNLNVGAINRQLRGVPDDFAGDPVETKYETAPRYTYGGKLTGNFELKGIDIPKLKGSLSLGVFSDSYTGIGAELGANAGLSVSLVNGGMLTGSLKGGINSNTSNGVTLTGGLSLDLLAVHNAVNAGASADLSYNTRGGFQELTLGTSFGLQKLTTELGATYVYNTPPFYPRIGFGYKNTSQSYSISVGGAVAIYFMGGALTGYFTKQAPLYNNNFNLAYGYLYADRGTNDKSALMDFMREKDNPIIPNLPNLGVPVSTPDLFSYTNQTGSGQFRLQRNGSGVVFDPNAEDKSDYFSLGADYGIGTIFHGGVHIYDQSMSSVTGKWKNGNNFLSLADYKSDPDRPEEQPAYFKMMGEQTAEDASYVNSIQGEKLVTVNLDERNSRASFHDKSGNIYAPGVPLKKSGRQVRNTTVSYLTGREALIMNFMKPTFKYALNDSAQIAAPSCGPTPQGLAYSQDGLRKYHHISEITVTEPDGKRAVYGIPVYNVLQEEHTFSANPANVPGAKSKKLLAFTTNAAGTEIDHNYGKNKFYQRQKQAPYATTYLLTQLLSPDYVDVKGDGITDDDLGTAVKFNYTKLNGTFGWRTPINKDSAFFNRGLNADEDDDKGLLTYGRKELWYLNSIETKTKIAYFILGDRNDALGVTGIKGNIDNSIKQKRLIEIRLYSKSDLSKPIKTAHFNYTYDLCKGNLPNSLNNEGKLTLKSVYFTYGSSTKGQHHRYTFDYATGAGYDTQVTDRWGVYKPSNTGDFAALKNDEYPYAVQDTAVANRNARMWNLTRISLPTGGSINVDYEAGDYAYVQDRKAMQMYKVQGLVNGSGVATSSLLDAKGIKIKAPGPLRGANSAQVLKNFVDDYLNGRNDFYVKMNVNVTDMVDNQSSDDRFDYISCYAEITSVKDEGGGIYSIMFKDVSEGGVSANPLIMAAWQKMRLEYPKYAYPGYEDRIKDESGIERALNALVHAIGNLAEIRKNFNERARDRRFATAVNLGKSYARLVKADGIKLGGPVRVKRVRMTDEWNVLSGGSASSAQYGQEYEYRTTEGDKIISSGVASYEPNIGGDENPMRMPVPYSQESRGTLTNYFYLEEPFGEMLFPAPQIGYSKVIVRDIDASGKADPAKSTGWIQEEFYTAKDFPVIVESQARPDVRQKGPAGWANFRGGNQVYELAMSQGYAIWLNDMHGKPKAQRIFNQSGNEISSTVTYYKTEAIDAGKFKLNNKVATIDETGTIRPAEVIGREIEMVTDMREQESRTDGTTIQIGVDVIPFPFIGTLPIPHWPRRENNDYRLFRSASVLKTIQQVGIVDKVVKMINGSSVTAANLIFDRITGQPVVTSTTNEFNDPVYAVNMPAWWKYPRMSGAYKNIGATVSLETDANGVVTKNASLMTAGDELYALNTTDGRLWVINTPTSTDPVVRTRVIDVMGQVAKNYSGEVKVLRSGYRNQLGASVASIVTLKNPVAGNKLAVLSAGDLTSYKVIDASAVLYEEEWAPRICSLCPPGSVYNPAINRCETFPVFNANDSLRIVNAPEDSLYSMFGAKIKKSDASEVIKKNDLWGGTDCTAGNASYISKGGNSYASNTSSHARIPRGGIQSVRRSDPYFTCGRLNRTGICLKNTGTAYLGTWMGIEYCFNITESKSYSLGWGADDLARIYIDDVAIVNTPELGEDASAIYYKYWNIIPVSLTVGKHRLRMEYYNRPSQYNSPDKNKAAIGVEIYGVSSDFIANSSSSNLTDFQRVFTTSALPDENLPNNDDKVTNTYILNQNGTRRIAKYSCGNGGVVNVCNLAAPCESIAPNDVRNPYVIGALGNWRVAEEKVYEVNRVDQQIFQNKGKGLNLKNSGYLAGFKSYWYYDAAGVKWASVAGGDKWVTKRSATLFDRYGQELENKNALNIYSSALYSFRGALPSAVAGNAMNREIFYDGFEDYKYQTACNVTPEACISDSFDIATAFKASLPGALNSDDSHSGKYSLKVNTSIELKTLAHDQKHQPGDGVYLSKDALGQYNRKPIKGLYPQGFAPQTNRTYIFSAWVKDGTSGKTLPNFDLKVNNVTQTFTFKAIVEGWKQIEAVVNIASIPNAANGLKFVISGNALVDDLRIFPFDATMKSYAYDESTLRLMAEMDENNFATFYEYDEEGTLIRVKKETDRGIMTLKESRSVFKKTY